MHHFCSFAVGNSVLWIKLNYQPHHQVVTYIADAEVQVHLGKEKKVARLRDGKERVGENIEESKNSSLIR